MAEKLALYERRWARAAASFVAVGALALGACKQGSISDNFRPKDYNSFGQLDCSTPDTPPLSGEVAFTDKSVQTFVIYAIMRTGQSPESMRLKFFGFRSSVYATNEKTGEVDVDEGVLDYDQTLVIDDVLPGVTVTAVTEPEPSQKMTVTAECSRA